MGGLSTKIFPNRTGGFTCGSHCRVCGSFVLFDKNLVEGPSVDGRSPNKIILIFEERELWIQIWFGQILSDISAVDTNFKV